MREFTEQELVRREKVDVEATKDLYSAKVVVDGKELDYRFNKLEDLGKGNTSQVGTIYTTRAKGPRYLELAEGYIVEIGLNEADEIIGYKYVNLGKMMDNIKAGIEPTEAIEKASGTYGRFDEAVKKIDPRKQ